ncbi:hypothetical protein Bca4012_035749 [Brassica carinata]
MTTTTEFGIVYAVHIITTHFGSVVSKVCDCLLRRGPLSSREISRLAESDINHNKVKDILCLLIHQNCVQAFSVEPPDGSESKATVQYIALFSNILHRARYSKFAKVVNEELGSQCGGVLEALLSNGRLTLEQLIDRDRGESSCLTVYFYCRHKDSKKSIGSEAMRDSLEKLVAARFVERVPSPEPVLGNKEEGPAQKKRGAKASKIFKEPESLEERILEAATPVDAIRFPIIFEQDSSSALADEDSNVSEKKRKQPDVDSSGPSNEVIWRPNFEELIRRLRHKACVEIVKERRDEGCANVLKAMLEMESVVMRRYGKEAFRMFRYLSQEDRFVETDKIADAALTEKKDTPQILLKMWKDGYLHMQKLAVTGVYMPFLLWKVNKLIVSRQMLDEMCHASLNVSLRLTHEMDSEKELLLLPMEKLEGALKERRIKNRAKIVLLSSTRFKLDDAIMLFHDF